MAFNLLAVAKSAIDWASINEQYRNTDQMFELFPISDAENGDFLGISIPMNHFNHESWDSASSFLKTVEVVKSPTADMIEGALGGTVSMRTVRPLELDGLTGAVSLDGEHADKTENWAPIFSGSIGTNWDLGDAGTFGAIAMLAYQDREIRQDEYFNRIRLLDE